MAASHSGATSAVGEGYNCLVVPQENSEATANAIFKILENPELKTKLGNNSRNWVKNFDNFEITKKYIEIYNAYLKHH